MNKRIIGIILIIICVIAYYILNFDFETPAIWQTSLKNKVLSDPKPAFGNYFFMVGNKGKNLYKFNLVDSKGQLISESQNLPHTPFEPFIIGNNIIMADHGRMLRAFALPDFKVIWEKGSPVPFEFPPLPCGESNVLQASGKSIFCFDSKNGDILWDITERDSIKSYACDKVIVTIHGYKDLKNPVWSCSAYDLEGDKIWDFEEKVIPNTPVFVQNTCILTTATSTNNIDDKLQWGDIVVLDQNSGEILYRSGAKGYIALKALNEGVILANQSYNTFVYLSLLTGKSWSSSLKNDFMGAVQIGSRLIIADKKTLRCFEIDTGILKWEKALGDIYGAFPHRNGAFITYKKAFTSRETYGICVGADSGENIWLAKSKSIFKAPCSLPDGDLLLNYDGTIRMMPKPKFKSFSDATIPTKVIVDPTARVNKSFDSKIPKTASNTQKINNNSKKTNQAIPSEIPTVSDEDAGW